MAAQEEVVLAGEVQVEGGPPDVGAIDDVLHRDLGIAPLPHQVDLRLLQQGARALYAPVS
ncbi:MAG TPA: hypothetical protein VGP82_22085 [Ktedonobacterales bacterium]|nr:hypothetical protein [Ktedonobacterales bacterium]